MLTTKGAPTVPARLISAPLTAPSQGPPLTSLADTHSADRTSNDGRIHVRVNTATTATNTNALATTLGAFTSHRIVNSDGSPALSLAGGSGHKDDRPHGCDSSEARTDRRQPSLVAETRVREQPGCQCEDPEYERSGREPRHLRDG
jgi:hypothetical protein